MCSTSRGGRSLTLDRYPITNFDHTSCHLPFFNRYRLFGLGVDKEEGFAVFPGFRPIYNEGFFEDSVFDGFFISVVRLDGINVGRVMGSERMLIFTDGFCEGLRKIDFDGTRVEFLGRIDGS